MIMALSLALPQAHTSTALDVEFSEINPLATFAKNHRRPALDNRTLGH